MDHTESRRFLSGPRLLAIALLSIFAVLYGVVCMRHGRWDYSKPATLAEAQASGRKFEKQGSDFTAYYSAGELARDGKNIYDWRSSSTPRRPFIYPPIFALFPMMPLSLLPHDYAHAVFYALNVLALVAGLWMLGRVLWPVKAATGAPFYLLPEFGLILTVVLTWRFVHANTVVGNANLFIFFLIAAGLYWDCKNRGSNTANERTSGILSGLAIGLATAIKITPGLFGLFFLWSWRKWSMLGGALGLILFFAFAPALWLGWEMNTKYLTAFAKNATGKVLTGSTPPEAGEIEIGWGTPKGGPVAPRRVDVDSKYPAGDGASIFGWTANLLTPAPALKEQGTVTRTVNILTMEPATARKFANYLSLALLALTAAFTAPAWTKKDPRAAALCWGLVAVTMALIAPLTRIAHLVVLILPVATLVALLQQRVLSGWTRILALSALGTLSLGCALVSGLARSSRLFETLQVMGFTTLAMLMLYAALAAALAEMGRQQSKI